MKIVQYEREGKKKENRERENRRRINTHVEKVDNSIWRPILHYINKAKDK